MRQVVRVVVIGGGIVGCSVLYHLAKSGWRDVVLLERQELTSGSSWHAAGGLFTVTRPILAARMHHYTFQSYRELENEFDIHCGFHVTGGLNICRTPEEMESNAIMQASCRPLGIESHFITRSEIAERAPILDTSRILGALWEVDGGHVDPASATQAFASAARILGADVRRHSPVTTTIQQADGSWVVRAGDDEIHCEYVVNAAGLWGREVGRLAGVELPLMPVEHHYLVTERIDEIERLDFELPQINDNENGCYARQEGNGLLVGAYEDRCMHWAKDGTPDTFGHELLPDDLGRIDKNMNRAVEIMPCLETAGVRRIINGPMIFSPDLAPLIGPHPDLENYFCANGVMAGFNQGAGVGRVIAQWIIEGEPDLDVFAWDVARFGRWADRRYTEQTTRYFYENRSERTYPYQEFEAGRPVVKTAVHETLADAGAVFGVSFGQEHPNWFASNPGQRDSLTFRQPNWWGPVADEGARIRNDMGLMEFSAMAKYEVTGTGAAAWLGRIMAGRIPRLGRIALSPMLSPTGRVIGDFSISHVAPDHFLVLGSDTMQCASMRWFGRYLPGNDVTVRNVSAELAGLHMAGPRAQDLLARISERDMTTSGFPFMSVARTSIGGIPDIFLLRISFTGECGYEMYLDRSRQAELFNLLSCEGRESGLALVGTRSLMHTRLEKGFAAWGLELSPDFRAHECGVMSHVASDGRDFIGRAAVLSYDAPRWRIATLTVDAGDAAVWGDEPVYLDGELVGQCTSGGWGPVVRKHIAMGYILPKAWEEDGNFSVEILGEMRPARLQSRPLYDPSGLRMRS